MKKFYFLIVAVFLFLSFTFLKSSKNGDFLEIYKDKDCTISMKRVSENKAWIKWQDASKTIKNKKGKRVVIGGKSNMVLYECDCEDQKYTILQSTSYDSKGNPTGSFIFGINSEYVTPDTIGELIFENICMKEGSRSNPIDTSTVTVDATVYDIDSLQ